MIKVVYNNNAIKNLLLHKSFLFESIYVFNINKRIIDLIVIAKIRNIKLKYCNFKYKFSYLLKKYNIVAKLKKIPVIININEFIKKKNLKILILYNIKDPHNLAACIRNAEVFNVDLVVLTYKFSKSINILIDNISQGSKFFIPIYFCNNLKNFLIFLKKNNIIIISLSIDSKNLLTKISYNRIAIIIGSEDLGIRKSIIKISDFIYKIPTYGFCGSMNLSVATGIILYEISKNT